MNMPPYVVTLLLTLFTWFLTALGSAVVFVFTKINQKVIDFMLSFSAGVMIASSIFSLLIPSISYSESMFGNNIIIPTTMFFAGGLFVVAADVAFNAVIKKKGKEVLLHNRKNILLFSAITFHNIPEGMCVGVAVASASMGLNGTLMGAMLLAFGIGVQNFPEGASISLPLRAKGMSKFKAFNYGQLSGIVEPIFAVLACVFTKYISLALPFLLAFSAGAMMCVSCTELIAEASANNKNLASVGVCVGFCLMMVLDLLF